ncbi:hypothetical protein ACTFIT_009942 [Dictyostelium discoideum]
MDNYNTTIKGCGRNQISISIGNQTTRTEFYFELPTVTSCSIENDQIIRCFGNFTNYTYFYENGKIDILFSNSTDEFIYQLNKQKNEKIPNDGFVFLGEENDRFLND